MSEERKATIFDIVRFYENIRCSDCGMHDYCDAGCFDSMSKDVKRANEIIIKWCDEHHVKTRQSEFLKFFPDVPLDDDNIILILPCDFDKNKTIDSSTCKVDCDKCRKNYWNEEIEQ